MKHILVEIEVSDEFAQEHPALQAADITVALAARDERFANTVFGNEPTPRYYGKARVLTEDKTL